MTDEEATKVYREAYQAGHAAGFALGYKDGSSTGYVDAKIRAWNALAAVEIPKHERAKIEGALRSSIGGL
jgi:flagellar biosynthesis/type III secretory pathway protein FliH